MLNDAQKITFFLKIWKEKIEKNKKKNTKKEKLKGQSSIPEL